MSLLNGMDALFENPEAQEWAERELMFEDELATEAMESIDFRVVVRNTINQEINAFHCFRCQFIFEHQFSFCPFLCFRIFKQCVHSI